MKNVVTTWNLTRVFGTFTAVDSLTLSIEEGEIFGFLGPNGAGKSTAVRMLCGILEPTAGTATVLGYDLLRQTEQIKRKIGYMSQKFSLYDDLTVLENLDFYAGLYSIPNGQRRNRLGEILSLVSLAGQEDELVANLSGGWKQRLALGCAIISRPSLVFLDEPTSGVSPTGRRAFFNLIQQLAGEGTTVIVTTHFMDEAERCHRIAFMSGGRLIAVDTPDNLKANTLQGCLVELELPEAMDRIPAIEEQPYVKECSPHGSLLHVLLDSPAGVAALERFTGAVARPITPSLEDVFVALARHDRARQPQAADRENR
ncbi:MAG: ABC transporter ATP-binding protein [Syntrophomonadaceae bacterium]|nr:ABC transporter ATP-binding protein [Syntrophomonadaceae bacterium]